MLKNIRNRFFKNFFRNMEDFEINMDELIEKRNNGAIIVDVRSTQEFNEGHLDGAINIPEYEINTDVYNILPYKDDVIVLYCSAGSRSKKAYRKLKKLQFKNVFSLYGGLDNWQ